MKNNSGKRLLPPAYAVEVRVFIVSMRMFVCVCVLMCVSVQAITFELVNIETSFLVW